MRTAIVVTTEASGKVSLDFFDDPLEARDKFNAKPDSVSAELWTSSKGRIKIHKAKANVKPAPVVVPASTIKSAPTIQQKGR
jgi:hypothetical protein